MNPEPFVPAQEAAKFVGIKPRFLMSLARQGIAGAYPLGTGQVRRTWVFRLSELATAIAGRNRRRGRSQIPEKALRSNSGSPR